MLKIFCISGKARHGKDTVANIMKEYFENNGKKVLIAHYADLLKYICKTFFNWDGKKDDNGRSLLQYIGTDVIREQQPDYWVNFIYSILKLFKNEWDYVIIPDCRFSNEIEFLKIRGLEVYAIRVNRACSSPDSKIFNGNLTLEQSNHISETALDKYNFDYIVNNDSDIEHLRGKVIDMIKLIK